MKKLVSLVLVLGLILTLSVFASAETTEYNWSSVEDVFNGGLAAQGSFWPLDEVDASFWLPAFFTPAEPTAEDTAAGCIRLFSVEDGLATVLVNYDEADGATLQSFYTYFTQNGSKAELVSVNDVPALLLRDEEHDATVLMYITQEGKLLQFLLLPLSSEELYTYVITSIRPNVKEEENAEPVAPVNPVSGLISK